MRQFPSISLPHPHARDSKMGRLCSFVGFLYGVDPLECRDSENRVLSGSRHDFRPALILMDNF
jgi:hypothetical protein